MINDWVVFLLIVIFDVVEGPVITQVITAINNGLLNGNCSLALLRKPKPAKSSILYLDFLKKNKIK